MASNIHRLMVSSLVGQPDGTYSVWYARANRPAIHYGPFALGSEHGLHVGDFVIVADLGTDMNDLVALSKYPYGS